jgi:Raf kinase inhibitor-like YbhB/YbcL family protein
MKIKSVFENNSRIPAKYTCKEANVNPELIISEVPDNTRTLVLIVDDLDAPRGVFTHWILFNIFANGSNLKIKGDSKQGVQGTNSYGVLQYRGPCPPSGEHRYFFKVYALNSDLSLKEGSTKQEVEKAMQGHILDKAELIGLYSKD